MGTVPKNVPKKGADIMIKIIDSTLAMLNSNELKVKQVLKFCELMKKIGIVDLEISESVYHLIKENLQEDIRYYLVLNLLDDIHNFPGIYKFIHHRDTIDDLGICQLQINDVREIIQLKAYKDYRYLRIVGLDDMICHKYNSAMKHMIENVGKSIINFCPENSYGCAVALAVQWILNGNSEITTSFSGCGNRAATEEVIVALRVAARFKINQDFSALVEIKELYEEMTNEKISSNKPIIGAELFDFEAGIHVDGIIKNPANYVPFLPEHVGRKFKIRIGKHSGRSSVKYKLSDLGINIQDEQLIKSILLIAKKQGANTKRGLNDQEFLNIVNEVLTYEGKEMDS